MRPHRALVAEPPLTDGPGCASLARFVAQRDEEQPAAAAGVEKPCAVATELCARHDARVAGARAARLRHRVDRAAHIAADHQLTAIGGPGKRRHAVRHRRQRRGLTAVERQGVHLRRRRAPLGFGDAQEAEAPPIRRPARCGVSPP